MPDKIENIIKELTGLAEEIKAFKKREIGYKSWLTKYKQENQNLIKTNNEICKQRDDALTELSKQAEILKLSQKDNLKDKKVEELRFANTLACQQRDEASKELSIIKVEVGELKKHLKDAKQAKENIEYIFDRYDEEIRNIQKKREAYQDICQRVKNEISDDELFANLLIREAERLLFEEEEILTIEIQINSNDSPQMFTDLASINRSLLDR
ncbi:MAG: hypothetical protein ACRC2S_01025 [Waterburya sp.]